MRINNITLCNIGSFQGKCTFDFTINKSKNIILIGGHNGSGKTTLFKSIKLGLYGPLTYNYQSTNHFYFRKVKDLINTTILTKKEASAFIEINFDIIDERDVSNYIIKRTWVYKNEKIDEILSVYKNNIKLDQDDILFFQNYIQAKIPPHLFDFFFFDGEEIASFFTDSNQNNYIKDSLLTLWDFDTFEHIRKFSSNYVRRNKNNKELEDIYNIYEKHLDNINIVENEIKTIENEIQKINNELEKVAIKKADLESFFKNSGGLTDGEREKLHHELKIHEQIKTKESIKIRSFVENILHFLIVKDMSYKIKSQLEKESQIKQYKLLNEKLNYNFIKTVIDEESEKENISILKNNKNYSEEFAKLLQKKIQNRLLPKFSLKDFKTIHDFSEEDIKKINLLINYIQTYDINQILSSIDRKNKSQEITSNINSKLKSSIERKDLNRYIEETNRLMETEIELNNKLINNRRKLELKLEQKEILLKEKQRLFDTLVSNSQDKNIYEITSKLSTMFEELIAQVSKDKFNDLKKEFMIIFNKILRKQNFIDDIDIDEDFNINLYRKTSFKVYELKHMLENLGLEGFKKILGKKSLKILFKKFEANEIAKLKYEIENYPWNESIDLFQRININQLSNGEKQIYILSLYWAMIKISSHNIPFIIDTPYARIDTQHRDNITTIFFPNIGEQVIILSTDEEINYHYYKKLKPYISKEYLLVYDKTNNKTNIQNEYFFEVSI